MTPAALAARIATGDAPPLLDVRSRVEFEAGHIPGAVNVPFWQLPGRLASVPCGPDDEIVVYCGHGPRAWMAGAVLRAHGFRRVAYLDGHMAAWRQAGLPQQGLRPS